MTASLILVCLFLQHEWSFPLQCCFSIEFGGALTVSAVLVFDSVSLGTLITTSAVGAIYNISEGSHTCSDRRLLQHLLMMRYKNSFHMHLNSNDDKLPLPQGMLGLAFRQLSTLNVPTLFDSFVDAKLVRNVFSMCFSKQSGGVVSLFVCVCVWISIAW